MKNRAKEFDEDSRVKYPAILHFCRLGYVYQTQKMQNIDKRNNIFVDIFRESIRKINNENYKESQLDSLIKEISDLTDNDKDKGRAFFERLTLYNKIKIIDLEEPENNDFRVVTELTFKGKNEQFRPDITILINGIPLAFYEVKKPNNKGYMDKKRVTRNGIQAEFARMGDRFREEEFNHFFNQFQILAFTNNQPYNDETLIPLQGSFYTTPNWENTSYNHFREEKQLPVNNYIDDKIVEDVLYDNNAISLETNKEFIENLMPTTYANSFATSIFSKERIIYFIKYGIVYVDSQKDGLNKHIIRYPQFFALEKLIQKIEEGMSRTVLWHTQGSGKTAFAYFATNILRDFYRKKKTITKFYFVTDRLDLLTQATTEFSDRGMTIATINNKLDFAKNIKSKSIIDGSRQRGSYKETMNVVNIQKFSEESTVELNARKDIQRIYFIDEVHRGYKLQGVFLANLLGSDPNGIFVGLTGTPILKKGQESSTIFQGYLHKYYYNRSIADGYTLKIKKENIATKFKTDIKKMIGIKEKETIPAKKWNEVMSTDEFVNQLCEYVEDDFDNFQHIQKDDTLGFMIVSSSSNQARLIQKWFEENSKLKTALVLYEEEDNKANQIEFRGKKDKESGKVVSNLHGVIVFNMLLTGFDAPRLKRLYLLRRIKEHSLLQTLARVNRPYKKMRYGYIVDFVDITEEYEETNRRYLEELREDIDDEIIDINDMIIDVEKIKNTITELENQLFDYMGNIENNLESFSRQIENLPEDELRRIKSLIEEYRICYNELRMSHEDVSRIPINRLNKAYNEVANRISLIIASKGLEEDDDNNDDIDYSQLIVEFLRLGEIDLDFTTENDILEIVGKINNAFSANLDKEDYVLKEIKKRYKEIIKKFKAEANDVKTVKEIIESLKKVLNEIKIINDNNTSLVNRYKGDEISMKIHKRFREKYGNNINEFDIYNIIIDININLDKLMLMGYPTQNVIIRDLLKPVRDIFKKRGHNLSRRQVEDIIYLFIGDRFKEE